LKRYNVSLLLFILTFTCLILFAPSAHADNIKTAAFDLGLGYRVDKLDWSIAGDTRGANPNILSELTWRDLQIVQLSLGGLLEVSNDTPSNWSRIIKGHFAFGQSFSGDNRDSDYNGDNRTLEWSRSTADAEARTFDLSAAFGVKYQFGDSGFSLTPLVGYSYNRQDLHDTNGTQVISNQDIVTSLFGPHAVAAALGPFPGLDSTYNARWNGPWFGLDAGYAFSKRFHLTSSFEYHLAHYLGTADWNLRTDFDHPLSFEQKANGNGILYNLAAEYEFSRNWSFLLSGNYQAWKTDHGSDRTFLVAGGTGITRLNAVNWESYALMTGISYRF